MATSVSYPGVYVEEVPGAVRTIAAVPTSVTAFVGFTARGPTDEAVQIFSFADFERQFGGLDTGSDLSYAVSHFFLNGGGQAWVVRVAKDAQRASIDLLNQVAAGGSTVLIVRAQSPGNWGNGLRIGIDYATANPASLFNLSVTEYVFRNDAIVPARSEIHRNLSMNSQAANYAINVVNAASNLIEIERPAGLAFGPAATSVSGPLLAADIAKLGADVRRLAISLDGSPSLEFDIFGDGEALAGANLTARSNDLATRIQAAVRALQPGVAAFANFVCARVVTGQTVTLTATSGTAAGVGMEQSEVRFANASRRNAAGALKLGLLNAGREANGTAAMRPARSGTVWDLGALDFTTLDSPGALTIQLNDGVRPAEDVVLSLWPNVAARPVDLDGLIALLQAALLASGRPALSRASVVKSASSLIVTQGGDNPALRLLFTAGPTVGGGAADALVARSPANVAAYQLGTGPTVAAQLNAVGGADGTAPDPVQLIGSRGQKTGLYALEAVDLFNILVLPNISDAGALTAAIGYAEERRAFALLDLPETVTTLSGATGWLDSNGSLRHRNAAAYMPRLRAPDPLANNRLRSFANSGALAGIFARTDGTRGVWKAPAGTDATVRGAQGLDYLLTDAETGVINPKGLNALRSLPAYGQVAWGARTLVGADEIASEWKYVPVRRLALFLEESLYRGTQWVVFEPNDEPLWSQIRLNIGAFMHTLFRQGAFQGKTPQEAYMVQCDSTTTTQDEINLGIVNINVGFAPLKPAEFVIIKLQQLAGQAGAGA